MKRQIPILLLVAVLSAGCVMNDDIVMLDERIFRLEQRQKEMENRLNNISGTEDRVESQLTDAQRQNDEQIQALRSQLAEFRAMNTQLLEDLQELTGRVEENEFRLRQRTEGTRQAGDRLDSRLERIDATTAENTDRIRQLEQYLSLERERAAQAAAKPTTTEKPAEAATESELYEAAKDAFDKEQFVQAREAFQKLLDQYPQSQEADNAQFWIGETYYREKWFEKAILEYQKVIEQYPKGNKVPSAMLKQGFAFEQLGDSGNARLILKELMRKYPETNEAKIAKEKLDKLG
jgi:tol-pal system protein YbgF